MKVLALLLMGLLFLAPAENPCSDVQPTEPKSGDKQLEFQKEHCKECKAEVELRVGEDSKKNEDERLDEPDIGKTHGCGEERVLCLNPQGKLLVDEEPPKRMRPGQVLTVKVIGCEKLQNGVKFKIEVENIASVDRLFRSDPTEAAKDATKDAQAAADEECKRDRLCLTSGDIGVLEEQKITVPKDDSVQRLEVKFSSDVSKATYKNLSSAKDSVSISVVQGRYFLDLGLMVPAVIEGRRRVVAEESPASGARTLAVDHDVPRPSLAVMLNVFPGGRRAGIFHAFAERERCNPAKASYFECKQRNHRRNAANSLGFQVGLDLDLSDPADAFFLGGLFEPVTGLSLNAGISLRKGQFLPAGRRVGQLIADDDDLASQTRYMVRPYIGLTFSLDIVRAIIAYSGKARGLDTGGD